MGGASRRGLKFSGGEAMTITETMTCNFHKHLQTSAS